MPGRGNHYSAAFEAYLRSRSIPYVNVHQAKKALCGNSHLKSFDFVVYSKRGKNILVDLNGRTHAHRNGASGFQSWTCERDVEDLVEWERVFGDEFTAVLTFVYWMKSARLGPAGAFRHRDRSYLLMGIDLGDYRRRMRRRSAKWETVSLPADDFRTLARPLESWL
ncbi:MAG TPA: HYExAFE family protein [Tepidisphaeraceae bacterium]|nr:HYExAFE family protein [Tepidisphaeraceae bacterium]